MEIRCPKYELIKKYYDRGYYSMTDIADYYRVGCLTDAEHYKITGNSFPWLAPELDREREEKLKDKEI